MPQDILEHIHGQLREKLLTTWQVTWMAARWMFHESFPEWVDPPTDCGYCDRTAAGAELLLWTGKSCWLPLCRWHLQSARGRLFHFDPEHDGDGRPPGPPCAT